MDREHADYETARLNAIANTEYKLKKKGICCHGWLKHHDKNGLKVECLECHKISTLENLMDERNDLLG